MATATDRLALAPPPTWHRSARRPRAARLDEYWPLAAYCYLYPLWWVLGLAHLVLFALAVPMAAQLVRRRHLVLPQAAGAYALFLVWVALGVAMLWVPVPGTEARSGPGPLVGFGYRTMWYVAITVVLLYVLNADRRRLNTRRITRMMAFLFLVTVAGGVLGMVAPGLDFPSAVELVMPDSLTRQEFLSAMFHPRVALESDFLGYDQPRITAPYSYPNTWGNAFGLLLPFFVMAWCGAGAGWRRWVAPFVLLAAAAPVVHSLNRGLWLGLAVGVAWVAVRLALAGSWRTAAGAATAAAGTAAVLLVTPLGRTVALRLSTPHSDARREDTAGEALRLTWEGSPLLGYGGPRQMVGNFQSIAGSGAADCHQCAAPPLGTQGYLWGLVFMTGFVGAALLVGFLLRHLWLNARRSSPVALLASTVLVVSLLFFLFYDPLDLPLLVTMVAVALAAREHAISEVEP